MNMSTHYEVVIVGCGLSGAVIAQQFASIGKKVLIIEKRDHIGGNVYDYVDPDTNILLNKYGAHLFHTNSELVWKYVNQFSEWVRWDHQVLASVDDKLVPIPVNINTVNALCNENICSEEEMNAWLLQNQVKYASIENSEHMGKSRVGEHLYNKMFKQYTYKQWSKYPEELDPSVLARIPVRNNFDNRYFDDKYQALPKHGYTHFVKNMIDHPNIECLLNTDYFEYRKMVNPNDAITVVFTGPIDAYYSYMNMDKLEYRSIDFVIERISNMNYFQPVSVVNYPELSSNVQYTRIVEYKHFLHQSSKSNDTIIVKEFTNDVGEPYYPIPNQRNMELYENYKKLAEQDSNVHFIGRLASYKYFNMDAAIMNALEYFDKTFSQ